MKIYLVWDESIINDIFKIEQPISLLMSFYRKTEADQVLKICQHVRKSEKRNHLRKLINEKTRTS